MTAQEALADALEAAGYKKPTEAQFAIIEAHMKSNGFTILPRKWEPREWREV